MAYPTKELLKAALLSGKKLRIYNGIDPTGDLHIGHRMRVKNVKNKVGNPFRETILDLMYKDGFNTREDMIGYAIMTGVLIEGTKTKTSEGNGVPKGWLVLKGDENNYRRGDLTMSPLYETIQIEAFKARDERLALAAKEEE